jgi:predicted  nucleic acid-binding Zn-ribbon protein
MARIAGVPQGERDGCYTADERKAFGNLGAKFDGLRAEFDALRSEVRANQQALMAALQNAVLRGEIGTQREISELRERVTRIEDQLSTLRQ